MTSNISMAAACPLPFLSQSSYSTTGGYIPGRFCSEDCCLPCPLENLMYSDYFPERARIAGWLSVVSLCCSIFLLLTFAVLPPEKSHRHYLSVGLCVSNVFLQLCFIVPLGTNPDQCYDDITPKDMYSSLSCAWTGAFLIWGGMGSVTWILCRSLWTHLRVCWDVSESRGFKISSYVMGFGTPTLFTAVCLKYTGVSYRLTGVCLPNDVNSFATYFGWMIAFASLAFALQLATSGYCLYVYLLNVWKAGSPSASRTTGASSDLPTSANKKRADRPWKAPRQQAWARVRKVFLLQWRNISLCMLVIAVVALLSGVFVSLNSALHRDKQRGSKAKDIAAWGTCLAITQDKNKCLPLARQLDITETPITAALIVTSLTGLNTFMLLMRWSTLKAWYDLVRHGRKRRDSEDFFMVSPRRITFEQKLASEAKDTKSPVESPVSAFFPGRGPGSSLSDDRSGVRYSSGSYDDGSIQHRLGSDASEQHHRASIFTEHPDDFEHKQTHDRGHSIGPLAEEPEKETHV